MQDVRLGYRVDTVCWDDGGPYYLTINGGSNINGPNPKASRYVEIWLKSQC